MREDNIDNQGNETYIRTVSVVDLQNTLTKYTSGDRNAIALLNFVFEVDMLIINSSASLLGGTPPATHVNPTNPIDIIDNGMMMAGRNSNDEPESKYTPKDIAYVIGEKEGDSNGVYMHLKPSLKKPEYTDGMHRRIEPEEPDEREEREGFETAEIENAIRHMQRIRTKGLLRNDNYIVDLAQNAIDCMERILPIGSRFKSANR